MNEEKSASTYRKAREKGIFTWQEMRIIGVVRIDRKEFQRDALRKHYYMAPDFDEHGIWTDKIRIACNMKCNFKKTYDKFCLSIDEADFLNHDCLNPEQPLQQS